ncbi:class I SAM-dependent methyltransferase [Kitasatospora sp. CM 4170]|uniref:Class I SAM-dependent methyltransferase n=1 Tax=Kitasatospora aburaviensis TaxID=67265 RepID=A0ABW1EV47_9ACTN|nr:class I SAM-dependent methyltransferase [Kitasatospora sp. CM 4170]WNM43623.1 class I SAM-dependent methyltransferase [Kitasatospora sp. CM 4170]
MAVVDAVEQHVRQARDQGLTATAGDARQLTQGDCSFDAVLLLGPLYHLPDAADRARAWQEARRVVRPGGVVAAAALNRYARLLDPGATGARELLLRAERPCSCRSSAVPGARWRYRGPGASDGEGRGP